MVICAFDLFGEGLYRYTFDNRSKERPNLLLGDECHKIIPNTKGTNDAEVEPALVNFLHYVENSSEEVVQKTGDERLKRLHERISMIRANAELEVTYMKMEERDRLIREDGLKEGREEGREEGRKTERIEIARALLRNGIKADVVWETLKLSEEELKDVLESEKNP